jgi:hypothetical protein
MSDAFLFSSIDPILTSLNKINQLFSSCWIGLQNLEFNRQSTKFVEIFLSTIYEKNKEHSGLTRQSYQ